MSMLDFNPSEGDTLIVVDMQKDFTVGTLPVEGADKPEFLKNVNYWITFFKNKGLPIIYTRDWHPEDHISFPIEGTDPDFVSTFPIHCVAETWGAEFVEGLELVELEDNGWRISKGQEYDREEFSGFWALDRKGQSILNHLLQKLDTDRIFVVGLATDFCVKNTVLSAIDYDYSVVLLSDSVLGVNPEASKTAIGEMVEEGTYVIY